MGLLPGQAEVPSCSSEKGRNAAPCFVLLWLHGQEGLTNVSSDAAGQMGSIRVVGAAPKGGRRGFQRGCTSSACKAVIPSEVVGILLSLRSDSPIPPGWDDQGVLGQETAETPQGRVWEGLH